MFLLLINFRFFFPEEMGISDLEETFGFLCHGPWSEVTLEEGCVVKRYDLTDKATDWAGMTTLDMFQGEKEIYEVLKGTGITPRLLEVGADFLRLERFDWSLAEALEAGTEREAYEQALREHVRPLFERLDELCVVHGDMRPANVVCDRALRRFALIDFQYAYVREPDDPYPNMEEFEQAFAIADLATSTCRTSPR
jgi:hypothetical protein